MQFPTRSSHPVAEEGRPSPVQADIQILDLRPARFDFSVVWTHCPTGSLQQEQKVMGGLAMTPGPKPHGPVGLLSISAASAWMMSGKAIYL